MQPSTQGVDAGLSQRSQVLAGDQPRNVSLHPPLLGERDEQGAGLHLDPDAGTLGGERPLVGAGGDGARRPQHAHVARAGHPRRRRAPRAR